MKTILVIEDDASVAEMLKDVLVREGFDVIVEVDGEWGLRAFQAKPIDLAIIDVLIPKIQGFDLIPKLRADERGKDLPIIVMSGVFRGRTYKADMSERFGINAYFDKPLDIDQLIDTLHDVFSSGYPEPVVPASEPERRVMPLVRPSTLVERGAVPLLDVPMKGDLTEVSFGRIFGGLFARRHSGALMLRRASVKKIVYLTEGIPVFVKSNLLSECLGRVMVSERLITRSECDRSLERKRRETGRRQGEILVEMGCISQHNLEFALELQMQTKLFEVFAWTEGRYHFNPSADYRGPQVALSMGPTTLVHEGASREMTYEQIVADLEPHMDQSAVATSDKSFRYQALQLDPRGERLIDRIDGRRTVRELLRGADFGDLDAALLIYALVCSGLIRIVPSPKPAPAPEPIELVESDVQSLSTAEINAIAARSAAEKAVESVREASAIAAARGATLRGRGTAESITPLAPDPASVPDAKDRPEATPPPPPFDGPDPTFERPEAAPPPVGGSDPFFERPEATPPPPPMDAPPVDPESPPPARISLLQSAGISDAPKRRPLTRTSSLPRTGTWATPGERTSEVPVDGGAEISSDPPELSEEARREVRERLEAEVMRLAEARKRERERRAQVPRRQPRSEERESFELDLEAERKRNEDELAERHEALARQTYYELLDVPTNAAPDQIRDAYQRVAKRLTPERVLVGRASHEARILAEKTYLLATRALNTLTSEEARKDYDQKIGLDPGPRVAALYIAEAAFERGVGALAKGDFSLAESEFTRSLSARPDDAVYAAHLAWSKFSQNPEDAGVRERSLGALLDAAAACPRSEETLLYLGAVARKHGDKQNAVSAYQRAIEVNPDCTAALGAMRELVPPETKKGGILSRYFAG